MAQNTRYIKSLYRSLLQIARNFDSNPSAKAVIYRTQLFRTTDATKYYADIVEDIFGSSTLFMKSTRHLESSFKAIVRQEFRPSELNEDFESEEKITVAFACIKKFSNLWAYYLSLGLDINSHTKSGVLNRISQPLSFPAELDGLIIHESDALFPGVLLVAHPMVHGPLERSVILILEHNASGTYGIVINKPIDTAYSLSDYVKNLPDEVLQMFGEHPSMFNGGPVKRLQCLHSIPDCGGIELPTCSQKTYSSYEREKVLQHLSSHPGDRSKFKLYAGCCIWDSSDIATELSQGIWMPVFTFPDKLVNLTSDCSIVNAETCVSDSADVIDKSGGIIETMRAAGVGISDSDVQKNYSHLWSFIMNKLGSTHKDFAVLPPCSVANVEDVSIVDGS